MGVFFGHGSAPRLFKMPGGEWHAQVPPSVNPQQTAFVRSASADDLLALSIWADAVHRDGGRPRAVIPYLPGARQDRRQAGEALSVRVYADIINACALSEVVYLDPHSPVMPALLDNGVELPLPEVVLDCLNSGPEQKHVGVIAPDAGAERRAQAVAARLKVPLYRAAKHRDPATGKLSGFTCEPLPAEGRLLVVDDICDGGGTFMGLAKATGLPRARLSLWVTHGVFSRGAELLDSHYSLIYTTDSHEGAGRFQKVADDAGLQIDVVVLPLFTHLHRYSPLFR